MLQEVLPIIAQEDPMCCIVEEEYEMLALEAHFDVPIFGNKPSFQCKFYKLCSKTIYIVLSHDDEFVP